jgi:hypothetical protein
MKEGWGGFLDCVSRTNLYTVIPFAHDMDSAPISSLHEHLLICTLPICAISSCAHIALFCQCHFHRLSFQHARTTISDSKQASLRSVTHSIAVCHSPSLQPTFSLLPAPVFFLDRYTFIAASRTMYPSFFGMCISSYTSPLASHRCLRYTPLACSD